jgi:hypothetical protein
MSLMNFASDGADAALSKSARGDGGPGRSLGSTNFMPAAGAFLQVACVTTNASLSISSALRISRGLPSDARRSALISDFDLYLRWIEAVGLGGVDKGDELPFAAMPGWPVWNHSGRP